MSRLPHTLEDFELELQSLRGAVLSMGQTAMKMVDSLGEMFEHNRCPDSSEAKSQERELDVAEVKVDEQARIILIRYQPVACDLREVTGAVRIATDLERVGDEARKVSALYDSLLPWLSSDADNCLGTLWRLSHDSLNRAIHAFSRHEVSVAQKVIDQKQKVRSDGEVILSKIGHKVVDFRALAAVFLDVVNVATALQRISNSAVNIAETVIFIETAEDVRHRHRYHEDG